MDDFAVFQASMKLGYDRDVKIFGLTVILTTWMEGYCLLPEFKN